MKIGNLVRFAHEQNGGPVHRVASVMSDGMVELHDMGGYFGPDLFVAADDIGGIPLDGRVPLKERLAEMHQRFYDALKASHPDRYTMAIQTAEAVSLNHRLSHKAARDVEIAVVMAVCDVLGVRA